MEQRVLTKGGRRIMWVLRAAWVNAGVVTATLGLAGCGGLATVDYARAYPAGLEPGPVLDIQVVKHPTELEMTNTTARAIGPSTLWLNQRFSRPIDGLAVGQTLTLTLTDFRDEYGEALRPGGFWASRIPTALVLAQLETPTPAPGNTPVEVQGPSAEGTSPALTPNGPVLYSLIVVQSHDE